MNEKLKITWNYNENKNINILTFSERIVDISK